MAVTITKKEQEALAQVPDITTIDTDIAGKVDVYCTAAQQLAEHLKELEPLQKMVSALKEELIELGETEAPNVTICLQGVKGLVTLSKKPNQVQTIDKGMLRSILGDETYFELADVKVGDIRKYCSPAQVNKVLEEAPTGKRRLTYGLK